jgi:putative oxidoreductase
LLEATEVNYGKHLAGRWALLPARLIVGFGFLAHGLAKFNRGPEKFAALLAHLRLPMPLAAAWLATSVEILGGIALLVGAFVAIACVPLAITMLVAMLTIHVHFGFSAVNTIGLTAAGPQFGPPGYEINLVYIAALAALALSRPTPLSVDGWRERTKAH